jgi:hypothetical protein
MRIISFIIAFIIGITIVEYIMIETNISTKATIIVFKGNKVGNVPIGRMLTTAGVSLENPNQEFTVVAEITLGKEKTFEILTIPARVLQNRINDTTIPLIIRSLHLRFLPKDIISSFLMNGFVVKTNWFFKTNYGRLK